MMGKRWNSRGPFAYQQTNRPNPSSPPHCHFQEESPICTLLQMQFPTNHQAVAPPPPPRSLHPLSSHCPEDRCNWAWTQPRLEFGCQEISEQNHQECYFNPDVLRKGWGGAGRRRQQRLFCFSLWHEVGAKAENLGRIIWLFQQKVRRCSCAWQVTDRRLHRGQQKGSS